MASRSDDIRNLLAIELSTGLIKTRQKLLERVSVLQLNIHRHGSNYMSLSADDGVRFRVRFSFQDESSFGGKVERTKCVQSFFPVNSIGQLRTVMLGGLTASEYRRWNIFKGTLGKTPFMKKILHDRQNGSCSICKLPLSADKSVIHHIDYAFLCHFTDTLMDPPAHQEKSIPGRRIAKCEYCHDRTGCIERVVLIHTSCHIYLHVKEGRIIRTP